MAVKLLIAPSSKSIHFVQNPFLTPKPTSTFTPTSLFSPSIPLFSTILQFPKKQSFTVYFFVNEDKFNTQIENHGVVNSEESKKQILAVLCTIGITSLAVIMGVYSRFSCQLEGGEITFLEMFGTFVISLGAAVGMEFWARWAHKSIWHASLWHMHESHHKPRKGLFELNDVLAIINAGPAIALLSYGFFHKGYFPSLCFVAGLEITVFGMAYMFIHDGLVHRRFPVGPIANIPYLGRVAAAHHLHHSNKFNGVPYGFFMGPKELEEVGGQEELEKEIKRRIKLSNGS